LLARLPLTLPKLFDLNQSTAISPHYSVMLDIRQKWTGRVLLNADMDEDLPPNIESPDYWRTRAEEARTLSEQMRDSQTKELMLGIAETVRTDRQSGRDESPYRRTSRCLASSEAKQGSVGTPNYSAAGRTILDRQAHP
jgi:hypothetical protein